MKNFKFFEHTADVEFEAYGKNLEETFENAALAMFETITDTKKIRKKIKEEFSIKSENLESLLYDFLEELIILHETKNIVFSRFKVKFIKKENAKFSLEGYALGEEFDRKKHESKAMVKAVTYHQMRIGKKDDNYFVHVVLDI